MNVETAKVPKITKRTDERLLKLRGVLRATKRPVTVLTLAGKFGVTRATMAKWIAMEAVRIKTGAVGLQMRSEDVREGLRGPKSAGFWVEG